MIYLKGLKGKSLHIYFRHSNVKRYELALMSHVEIFPSDLLYLNSTGLTCVFIQYFSRKKINLH